MSNLRSVLVGVLAMVALSPAVAMAKNYCITGFPNSAFVLVGEGFTVPSKGSCKAWLGFNPILGRDNPVSGVGCTSSDGTNLSLNLTTAEPTLVEVSYVSITLASHTGTFGGQIMQNNGVTSVSGSGLTAATCTTSTIPATEDSEVDSSGAGASVPLPAQ
jgi:hypothetical protein